MDMRLLPSAAFKEPAELPGDFTASDAAQLLSVVADIALLVETDGTIVDVAVPNPELADTGANGWVGTNWADAATDETKAKVRELIDNALSGLPPRWRQLNHATALGDVPVRYMTIRRGTAGRILAVGRDMRATSVLQQRLIQTQQSLERDYLVLRQAEARYRLLFDAASEPVMIVDASTRRIREANPAAHRLLGVKDGSLKGQPVGGLVIAEDQPALFGLLSSSASADHVPAVDVRRPGAAEAMRVSATSFRQDRAQLLLVKLSAVEAVPAESPVDIKTRDIIERMPDAFVLVDAEFRIVAANAAFAELAEVPSAARLHGAALGTWLGRPGIDLDLISAQLREHGSIRNLATILRGAAGAEDEVEVSGVVSPGDDGDTIGFTIRSVSRRQAGGADPVDRDRPRSVEQLTELVGRMPLKDIVRESTDLIERLCIEAALTYTSDNRASAAEILGVSRQSLYSKLHRHGLGNLTDDD